MKAPGEEMPPDVDGTDRIQGTAPLSSQVNAGGLRQRAVHILLFDPRGRHYMKERSPLKQAYPGKWTSPASCHVGPG